MANFQTGMQVKLDVPEYVNDEFGQIKKNTYYNQTGTVKVVNEKEGLLLVSLDNLEIEKYVPVESVKPIETAEQAAERIKAERYAEYCERYNKSIVAGEQLPAVNGAQVRYLTAEERYSLNGNGTGLVAEITVDDYKVLVRYTDTASGVRWGRKSQRRMRWELRNKITEYNTRHYGSLESCAKKVVELFTEYKVGKELEQRQKAFKKRRAEVTAKLFADNFPAATPIKYGSEKKSYEIKLGNTKLTLSAHQEFNSEEGGYYPTGKFVITGIKVPVTAEQVASIVKILNQ